MLIPARRYSHEKAVVLNALYDALEAVGLDIDESNSTHGTLIVSFKARTADRLRIILSPSLNEETTLVEIYSENGRGTEDGLSEVLLDEMEALMKRAWSREGDSDS